MDPTVHLAQKQLISAGNIKCLMRQLHPAGSSNDSDKCDSIQRFWHDFLRGITMAVYEIFFFTFFM